MTESRIVKVCPFCDSQNLDKRLTHWRCNKCRQNFETPIEQPSRKSMFAIERASISAHPLCPECGKAAYRSPRRPREKYRCRLCGAEFDEPLKPGRKRAAKKQAKKRLSRADREAARRAKQHAIREAQFERKIAESKAWWHQKYDGDIIKMDVTINGEQLELYGTRAGLAEDVKEIMSQIIDECYEKNQKKIEEC